jgi:hypothetical protein
MSRAQPAPSPGPDALSWVPGARGGALGDWAEGRRLHLTDPYLVWFDITGFRGAGLAAGPAVPVIEQWTGPTSARPLYRTRHVPLSDLATLANPALRPAGLQRFEIAPGLRTGDGKALVGAAGAGEEAEPRTSGGAEPRTGAGADRRAGASRQIIGFIDYGCGFAHPRFQRSGPVFDTRVLAIWNQAGAAPLPPIAAGRPSPLPLDWRVPPDFGHGVEVHRRTDPARRHVALGLNDFAQQFMHQGRLMESACYRHAQYDAVQGRDWTHGTWLMDIATGHPDPLRQSTATPAAADGAPHEADIVFVQLPRHLGGRTVGGLLRAHVLDALRYIASFAGADIDVVVNLGYGGYAGPHDGRSLLEQAIDSLLDEVPNAGRFQVVVAAGNQREGQLHAVAEVPAGGAATFHWHNLPDDPSDSFVEIWLPQRDTFDIRVRAPGMAEFSANLPSGTAAMLTRRDCVAALVFPEQACQSDQGAMALLAVAPTRPGAGRAVAPYGRWEIEVCNLHWQTQTVHAWCERDEPAPGSDGDPRQGRFGPGVGSGVGTDQTLNSIAHGWRTVVVGADDGLGKALRSSGVGPRRGEPVARQAAGGQVTGGPAAEGSGLGGSASAALPAGVTDMAPSDERPGVPGLAACSLLGGDSVRNRGTSVAAAVQTRRIIESGFLPVPRPRQ